MNETFELLKSVARQDAQAFHQLYELFSEKVYNIAMSYVQNEQDAEEVTQDVFTSIFRNASTFKGEAAVHTWVYRIAVNASLNFIRRKKRFSFLKLVKPEIHPPDFEHPGVVLEKKEAAKILFKVIDTLPESQKTAFILSFVEELPRQEVAEIMEISLKAVEALLQRAKKNLRDKLEEHYPHRRRK